MDIQKNGGLTVEAKQGLVKQEWTGWVWAIGKTFHSGYLKYPRQSILFKW